MEASKRRRCFVSSDIRWTSLIADCGISPCEIEAMTEVEDGYKILNQQHIGAYRSLDERLRCIFILLARKCCWAVAECQVSVVPFIGGVLKQDWQMSCIPRHQCSSFEYISGTVSSQYRGLVVRYFGVLPRQYNREYCSHLDIEHRTVLAIV